GPSPGPRSGADGGASSDTSFRSTPAQKAGSAPVMITAATSGSSPAASTASQSPYITARLSALRASGRLRVTVITRSSTACSTTGSPPMPGERRPGAEVTAPPGIRSPPHRKLVHVPDRVSDRGEGRTMAAEPNTATDNGEATVNTDLITRAVELADLNAVRVALYQHTGDPELAALPKALELDDAQRALLIDKAVAWLEQHAGPGAPEEPPEDELRVLMNMATQETMGDLEFTARRG